MIRNENFIKGDIAVTKIILGISEQAYVNGVVLSVGEEVKEVKAGDRVKYCKSGVEFRDIDGTFVVSIRADDIVAIL